MDKCIDSRGTSYLSDIFMEIAYAMGVNSPSVAIELFREMQCEMELKQPVSVYKDQDLYVLSSSVNPVRLKNNPIALDDGVIVKIYNNVIA